MTNDAESGTGRATEAQRWEIPGSERLRAPGASEVGAVAAEERVEVTVVLRRRQELPAEVSAGTRTLSRQELGDTYGGDPDDLATVRRVFTAAGLDIVAEDLPTRRVSVAGTVEQLATVFGTTLSQARIGDDETGREFRHRSGALSVPTELSGLVVAVLGLDDRPQSRTRLRIAAASATSTSYTPVQLAQIYDFPDGTDGTGQTVAIIELGGGYTEDDLSTYFSALGVTAPSVTAVGVDGGANTPTGDPGGPDGEVMLDVEVLGGAAPGAAQVVYFAPNTDRGFLDAVTTATSADPTPVAVSISWGGPEDTWTAQSRTAMDEAFADAVALGVTVCIASGDGGSSDGETDGQAHVDFPASSPHVLACGGTSLQADAESGTITSETVWTDSGGGVSTAFDQPAWQAALQVPTRAGGGTGRGVPDVSAVADPATGYQVRVDGTDAVYGGTSAVAPLWSALIARLAQGGLVPSGTLVSQLYAGAAAGSSPAGFRDITSGSNGDYQAAPGWDACSGIGVPVGADLLTRLSPAPAGSGAS